MDALDRLHSEVRDLVRQRDIHPTADPDALHGLVHEAINDYLARSDAGLVPPLNDPDHAVTFLIDSLAGLGKLEPYMMDDSIEEIWVNAPDKVFIARGGHPELTTTMLTAEEVEILVERMLRASGRRLDLSVPFVDAQLPGGQRLHVVIPPLTQQHWSINIRKHVARATKTHHLVQRGSMTDHASRFLDAAVHSGLNILVSGATQAGKTTLVRALAGAIPPHERVITCEEVFELSLRHRDCVALQTRNANIEGSGAITLRHLIVESLRMRPDRLIIGEVRGAESLDLLIAMNSGLPSMSTIHANSAREALMKLCTLPLLAGENVSSDFVLPTVANCIDLVVFLGKNSRGHRQVQEIAAVGGRVDHGIIEMTDVFYRDHHDNLVRGSGMPSNVEQFERAGFDLPQLLGAQA
ncbi:CpaF family protein [Actinomyces vulturis]|uniref:CpaF family protein n=1 Tax=Actinomyces vulturis TaxID=1857645 RepID=UPI0008295FA2|nr:ATPase, T2SS/T4P/T4SS family [Actinomyces vulturis]